MFEKMKQLMDMQKMAKEAQRRLADITAEGSALGGKVRVVMTGTPEIKNVSIDDSLAAAGQRENLERGVLEAVNDALSGVRDQAARAAMEAMKGLKMP